MSSEEEDLVRSPRWALMIGVLHICLQAAPKALSSPSRRVGQPRRRSLDRSLSRGSVVALDVLSKRYLAALVGEDAWDVRELVATKPIRGCYSRDTGNP